MTTIVNEYNTTIQAINTQEGKDSPGIAEPLYGSAVLAQIQEGTAQLQLATVSSSSNCCF